MSCETNPRTFSWVKIAVRRRKLNTIQMTNRIEFSESSPSRLPNDEKLLQMLPVTSRKLSRIGHLGMPKWTVSPKNIRKVSMYHNFVIFEPVKMSHIDFWRGTSQHYPNFPPVQMYIYIHHIFHYPCRWIHIYISLCVHLQ